jgi:endonuclease/exonuclease/phosphatase family metal-dependent hydrolase
VEVRVGTWNLENLFLPGGQFGPPAAVFEQKLDGLASTIGRMAPDLLGVQEVGSADALDQLVARLDGDWQVALSKHFDSRHPIRVGFLSRHPLEVLDDRRVFPAGLAPVQVSDPGPDGTLASATQAGRGALAVRIQPPGTRPVQAVCCHLKSKLLSFPAPGGSSRFSPHDEGERARVASYALFRRAAEAAMVRDLATRLLTTDGQDGHSTPVVVLGDLNDEPAAATTQILYGPPGSQLDTPGFTHPDQGDRLRLWNLANRIPAEQRFTRRFEGHGELIDHILVSHTLLTPLPTVEVIRQAGLDQLPSITADAAARRTQPASDHAAVLAHLQL